MAPQGQAQALAPALALRRSPLLLLEPLTLTSARKLSKLEACKRVSAQGEQGEGTLSTMAHRNQPEADAAYSGAVCILLALGKATPCLAGLSAAPHPPAMPKVDRRRFCTGAAPPVSVANTGVFFGVALGRGIAAGPAGVPSPTQEPSAMLPEPCCTVERDESFVALLRATTSRSSWHLIGQRS